MTQEQLNIALQLDKTIQECICRFVYYKAFLEVLCKND